MDVSPDVKVKSERTDDRTVNLPVEKAAPIGQLNGITLVPAHFHHDIPRRAGSAVRNYADDFRGSPHSFNDVQMYAVDTHVSVRLARITSKGTDHVQLAVYFIDGDQHDARREQCKGGTLLIVLEVSKIRQVNGIAVLVKSPFRHIRPHLI